MTVPTPAFSDDNLSNTGVWTHSGSPSFVDDQHSAGSAMDADGVNDYTERTAGGIITSGTAMTSSGWFKSAGLSDTSGAIISQANAAGTRQYLTRIDNSGRVVVYYFNASGGNHDNFRTDGTNYLDDEWHHYVAAWSLANSITIHIDGAKETGLVTVNQTFDSTFGGTIQKVRTGINNAGANKFKGELSRPRLWSVELSDAEAVEEFNNEVALIGSGFASDPVASGLILPPIMPKAFTGILQSIFGANFKDWTPDQLTTTRWLDAQDASTIIAGTGDGVLNWLDKSNVSIHALQTTAADQPETGTRDINGHNVLDFDGVNHFMNLMSNVTVLNTTVFAVLETDSLVAFQNILGLAANNFQMRIDTTTGTTTIASGTPYWGSPSVSTEAVVAGTPVIVGFVFDASGSISHIINDIRDEPATGNDGAGFTGFNTIGNREGVDHFNGKIGELLIFDTVLTTDEIELVQGYLAHHWSMASVLSAGHTYKDEAPKVLI